MSTFISQALTILTILGDVLVVVLIGSFWANRSLREKISEWALPGGFLIALIATSGSLFYSEVLHYTPCLLCWYQRIFMYPMVLLLGVGLVKKDRKILGYSLWMSLVGGLISTYHYLVQLGWAPGVCSVVGGQSVSCSQRFVMEYGYVTLPIMAWTAFTIIFLLSLHYRKITGSK